MGNTASIQPGSLYRKPLHIISKLTVVKLYLLLGAEHLYICSECMYLFLCRLQDLITGRGQ